MAPSTWISREGYPLVDLFRLNHEFGRLLMSYFSATNMAIFITAIGVEV
jgi:hypothetical protein